MKTVLTNERIYGKYDMTNQFDMPRDDYIRFRRKPGLSETVLDGGEEAAGAELEAVFGAGKGAVVDVFVVAAVEQIVGCERQAYLCVQTPYRRGVKKYKVGGVTFGKTGQEMFGPYSELRMVIRYYGGEKVLMEGMIVVCLTVDFQSGETVGCLIVCGDPSADAPFEIRFQTSCQLAIRYCGVVAHGRCRRDRGIDIATDNHLAVAEPFAETTVCVPGVGVMKPVGIG